MLSVDINQLKSQHQISVSCAAAATSRLARTKHLAAADLLAHRIDVAKRQQGGKIA